LRRSRRALDRPHVVVDDDRQSRPLPASAKVIFRERSVVSMIPSGRPLVSQASKAGRVDFPKSSVPGRLTPRRVLAHFHGNR
jgi:hypothetical protein